MDKSKSSATARTPKDRATRLAKLEDRYRHELAGDDIRQEWRDQILRLRRRLGL